MNLSRNFFLKIRCIIGFVVVLFGGALLPVLTGCTSSPEDGKEPVDPNNVWSVLKSGDGERAKAFFTGDVDVLAVNPQNGMTPLHYAAANDDYDLVAYFIFMGADVDALDTQGRTPLAVSVSNTGGDAQERTVSALVEGKSDIFASMPTDTTPAAVALTKLNVLKGMIAPSSVITREDADRNNLISLALARPDSQIHMEAAEMLIRAGSYSASPLFSYLAPAVRSANYSLRVGDGITPLHYAARQGYTGLTAFLLDRGADVNAKTAAGSTPLHEAAMSGSLSCMEMLIEAGADVNAQDATGNSILHIAVPAESHARTVEILLAGGANPNLRDEYGDSPLHIIISLGRDPAILQALLSGGADASIRSIDGKTPLYLAVEDGKTAYITPLLASGSDIFAADNTGVTPFAMALSRPHELLPLLITETSILQSDGAGNTMLHIAESSGAGTETLSAILDKGAVVDARNKGGDTALNIAVRQNDEAGGALLLERKADIFAVNAKGESPLYSAFFPADGRIRRWMLTAQTLDARDGLGNTALHYAPQWKIDVQIPLMVRLGADIEARNATGETPLFSAVKYNAPGTIKALADAGASIDQRDRVGNTALHAAVRWNTVSAGETLIRQGCNVNARALNGKTALHDAVRLGNTDMELLLTRNGADINARDAEGNTPLMEAVAGGFSAPAERLAALSADAGVRNIAGDTPLHLAVKMNRADLAATILKLGASIHSRNAIGQTPFRIALVTSPSLVSLLLSDRRVLRADDDGLSPLHIAVIDHAPLPMIQAIVAGGARLDAVDSNGRTPLRLAVDQEDWQAVKLLAESGSDVFAEGGDGKSPAAAALAKGSDAVDALFSGATISARDRAGNTILHIAAQYGTIDEVNALLALGADKTARNISGETAAQTAARWNRADIAVALE